MGQLINLETKSHRHATESTVWGLERDCRALQVLANDGAYFFHQEVADIRRVASDLMMIALQVETNLRNGSK